MNRVHLATAEEDEPPEAKPSPDNRTERPTKPAERHIGSAFAGLKKLFGREH